MISVLFDGKSFSSPLNQSLYRQNSGNRTIWLSGITSHIQTKRTWPWTRNWWLTASEMILVRVFIKISKLLFHFEQPKTSYLVLLPGSPDGLYHFQVFHNLIYTSLLALDWLTCPNLKTIQLKYENKLLNATIFNVQEKSSSFVDFRSFSTELCYRQ